MSRPPVRPRASIVAVLSAAILVAACGSATTPSATAAPTEVASQVAVASPTETLAPTPSPTVAPTPAPTQAPTPTPTESPTASPSPSAPGDPFADKPYSLVFPTGWSVFDPTDPTSQAALEAAATANPSLAPLLKTFETSKVFLLAVNQLTGNVLLSAGIPSQGLSLAVIGQSLTAQFKAVPGVKAVPAPKSVKLKSGLALHWTLSVAVNKVGGGTTSGVESIYLVESGQTAVIVEFVTLAGGVAAKEGPILDSLVIK